MMTPETRPRAVVLLVEDHADSRMMYVEFLRMQFDVVDVADGVAAMERLGTLTPDVMVTDLSLPRLDGFELIRRSRTDPRLSAMGVIALSGYSSPDHESRARKAGAEVILQKPCLPDQLAEAIATLASRRKDNG